MKTNIKQALIGIIFSLSLTLALIPASRIEVQAKTADKETVAAAYEAFLTTDSSLSNNDYVGTDKINQVEFSLIDVNSDGQKELYITGDGGYHANIYAYTGGKVKLIDSSFSGSY